MAVAVRGKSDKSAMEIRAYKRSSKFHPFIVTCDVEEDIGARDRLLDNFVFIWQDIR